MRRWAYRVELADIFRNEDIPFEQRRDEIVRRIKDSEWFKHAEGWGYSILPDLVDELKDTESPEDFNRVWNAVYDEADGDRCWIATF